MNKRIYNKVYKRAHQKLELYKKPADKRSYLNLEKEDCILSSLERRVFFKEEGRRINFTDAIIDKLKNEGKW